MILTTQYPNENNRQHRLITVLNNYWIDSAV